MDDLVEKASELGADRLIPFASQRTVARLGADRIPGKCRHWARISRSAAKQSGRGTPLAIEPPVSFEKLMGAWNRAKGTKVILWEEEAAQDFKGLLAPPAARFVGVVGPEGGFDTAEVQLAQRAGFTTASLGHRILRAQTAAIAMVALVQFAWGDLGAPPNWDCD
jgi:16S rRNA (uracil1498-N3)-methyltransferase